MESQIIQKLTKMEKDRKYIFLSLHPPFGSSAIQRENNRLFINEGRDGKYEGVSELFYDSLVDKFDSRYK